jgi:hypothetical protein
VQKKKKMTFRTVPSYDSALIKMSNLRHLTLNCDLLEKFSVFSQMLHLEYLELYAEKHHNLELLAHCIKASLPSVVILICRNLYFNVEIQTFLAYFLRNVKSLQFFGCESLKPSDFLYIKKRLPNITEVHVEMNTTEIERWAEIVNTYCGTLRFHINMIDIIPRRMLQYNRAQYRM